MCLLDFGLGDRLHDVADLGLEGRAAHQEAVDVRERRELGRVLSVRAAAVPVWKSKFYGAFVLNHRVVLHAIDSMSARWNRVHPTH